MSMSMSIFTEADGSELDKLLARDEEELSGSELSQLEMLQSKLEDDCYTVASGNELDRNGAYYESF